MAEKILEVSNLKKYYPIKAGLLFGTEYVKAVDGVSINLVKGETLGLVGESGCGKSTIALTILRLTEPTEGKIFFRGKNVLSFRGRELKDFRRQAQIIFQNPFESLNPRMKVLDIVGRPMIIHGLSNKKDLKEKVINLLEKVRLEPEHIYRYPHEFSGGQRQRIAIARALSLNPKFIILDEPTSSLDVSVQALILNDLKMLQRQLNLTYLFISHAINVIKHMSHRIAVMYLGKIVEIAKKEDLFKSTSHPYTEALLSAVPVPNPHIKKKRIILSGDVPSPINPPSGCRFHPRCPYAKELCRKEEPKLTQLRSDHYTACHFSTEIYG